MYEQDVVKYTQCLFFIFRQAKDKELHDTKG